jgi:hypothetical protein
MDQIKALTGEGEAGTEGATEEGGEAGTGAEAGTPTEGGEAAGEGEVAGGEAAGGSEGEAAGAEANGGEATGGEAPGGEATGGEATGGEATGGAGGDPPPPPPAPGLNPREIFEKNRVAPAPSPQPSSGNREETMAIRTVTTVPADQRTRLQAAAEEAATAEAKAQGYTSARNVTTEDVQCTGKSCKAKVKATAVRRVSR